MNMVSVSTMVPSGSLSAAAATLLSAGSSMRPSWLPFTIGNALPRPAARSTAVRRLGADEDDRRVRPGVKHGAAPRPRRCADRALRAVKSPYARRPRHAESEPVCASGDRSIQPPIAFELDASSEAHTHDAANTAAQR